jgi:hypothetical protein
MKIRKTRKTWVRVSAFADIVPLLDGRLGCYEHGEITVPVKVR